MLFFRMARLYNAYTHSHLGAGRLAQQSIAVSLTGVPLELVGINCLAQGHFCGSCGERRARFSLTLLSRLYQPVGETEPATSVISFSSLHPLFGPHD